MVDGGPVGDVAGETPDGARRGRRWRRTLAWVAAAAVLAAGLFGLGVSMGSRWAAQQDLPQPETSVVTVEVPRYGDADTVVMPDVRGLAEPDAVQAVADAGVPASDVKVTRRPAAGQPGLVVEQEPAFGAVAPASVALVVSQRAVVPPVVGEPVEQVTAALEELGARVVPARVYVPDAVVGTVVSVSPGEGEPVPDSVDLVVAEAAAAVFLNTVEEVEGDCSADSVQVDGVDNVESVLCWVSPEPEDVVYLLDRVVDEVDGVLGVPDTAGPDARVTMTVLVDGKRAAQVNASYGKPAEFSVPTAGALRLTLRLSGSDKAQEDYQSVPLVLGDARLLGSPDTVTAVSSTGG